MYIWQKILIAVLAAGVVAATAFGIIQFRKVGEMDAIIVDLREQLRNAQQTVEPTVQVLQVMEDVKQGTLFNPSKIGFTDLPISKDNEAYCRRPELLKDAIWRLDLSAGSLITEDMFAFEPVYPTDRYQLIMVDGVTPSLEIGDFVDIRMITADGIDFVVMPKKRIINLYSSGLEVVMSEAEWMIYCGSLIDKFMHRGTIVYASKYVDPSLQNKLYSTYIPPKEIVDYMNLNKNMLFPYVEGTDVAGMRAYIESVQPWNRYSASLFSAPIQQIRDRESKITAAFASQISSMMKARSEFDAYMRRIAEEQGITWEGTAITSTQHNTENVGDGQISGGAQRPNEVLPNGNYIDEDGVVRRPDGTPVIQAGDIVNNPDDTPEEAEIEDDNTDIPNLYGD